MKIAIDSSRFPFAKGHLDARVTAVGLGGCLAPEKIEVGLPHRFCTAAGVVVDCHDAVFDLPMAIPGNESDECAVAGPIIAAVCEAFAREYPRRERSDAQFFSSSHGATLGVSIRPVECITAFSITTADGIPGVDASAYRRLFRLGSHLGNIVKAAVPVDLGITVSHLSTRDGSNLVVETTAKALRKHFAGL